MLGLKSNKLSDVYSWFKASIEYPYHHREIRAITDEIFHRLLHMSPDQRILGGERRLPESTIVSLKKAMIRLNRGEPVQYITGVADFLGHTIHVGPGVLIPRQETVELVLWVKDGIEEQIKTEVSSLRILDFGTGSGCIAIALSAMFPKAEASACDHSHEILKKAKHSSLLNNCNVHFFLCNALDNESDNIKGGSLDFLVSNPPYVKDSEKEGMQANVVSYEPHEALFVPDDDPLLFYRNIGSKAKKWLKPGGWVYFEINETMGAECHKLLSSQGYSDIYVKKDINGKDRFIRARKPVSGLY